MLACHRSTVNTQLHSLCVLTGRVKIRAPVFHSRNSEFKISGYCAPGVLTLMKSVYFAHNLCFNLLAPELLFFLILAQPVYKM